jgi:hypothetical protein
MAQYLKSHSPQELWKASLKPQDPFKPQDPAKQQDPADPSSQTGGGPQVSAAKAPGTGVLVDTIA